MNIKLKLKCPLLIISFLLMAWSCDTFVDDTPVTKEVSLDVSGTWKIIKATRNDSDIGAYMDFTQFRLKLNKDGIYSIENYCPFIVKKTSGKWEIDNPVYPFLLSFYDMDGSNEIRSILNYPIFEGKRRIVLSFSLGCSNNTYSYTFEKENN